MSLPYVLAQGILVGKVMSDLEIQKYDAILLISIPHR